MFGLGKKESRKFIDLLLQSTNNKWTNIDASKEIKVGDFGYIERSTGEFLVEGNLYKLASTREQMEAYPVIETASTDFEKYTSKGVKELGFSPKVSAALEMVVDVELDAKWQFKRDRGALLVLLTPKIQTMSGLPIDVLLDERHQNILKGKSICTDVFSCPGFCLYLSNSEEHVFDVSLNGKVPIPNAPGVTAGGGIATNWKVGHTQGVVKQGMDAKGRYVYYPLFGLKQINWGKVSTVTRGEQPKSDEIFEDMDTPWSELDDEGEEAELLVDTGEELEDFKP